MTLKPLPRGTSSNDQIEEHMPPQEPLLAASIIGYFERCDVEGLAGWFASTVAVDRRLEIDVFADGHLLTRAVADVFRADLVKAGIGDGKHAFKVMLPPALFDGNEHTIEVREVSSGLVLPGSPKTFRATLAARGNIWLDAGALGGWAILPAGVDASLPLEVMEGAEVVTAGRGTPDSAVSSIVRFRLPLPTAVFDGRPHLFSVRSGSRSLDLGDLAVITPFMFTPHAVLRHYGREGLKPALATAAGFRYESLVRRIELLAQRPAASADKRGRESGAGKADSAQKADLPVADQLGQLVRAHAQLVRGFSDADKAFEPLAFPTVKNPRVSIVIPVHDKFPVTYHCLASLLVAANRASFEVILVDDGSTDESTRIPELIKGVQYARNDENRGFIHSCNRGAELARGDYIVMLNNDTEVTCGWLDELLWVFEHFDKVGLAGAKLLGADGTLQEAGGIVWNNGDPWNYGRQANPRDPRYTYARQVDYASGACIMLPRALWNELGGFDVTFAPAYFEDTDLAFRVRDKGYKTVYAPLSQVIHFEGISSGTSTAAGAKRFQEINRPKFKSRWLEAFRHNGRVGVDPELNKDRNVEFRVLVLDAETPMPDQNAGSHAAIQEMRMLQALGFKCTFVPQNVMWLGHYTEALQRMGVECLYAPFAGSINEVIEKRGSEFDLVYIIRYYVAHDYVKLIRQHAPQAKIIMNNCDLHFLRELRAAVEAKSDTLIAKATVTRDAELATMRGVDLVLSYTDVEKAVILSHNGDATRVATCPWVTDIARDIPGFEARADIAFLAGYRHHPNAEAVEWFAGKVMPLLRETLPGVKFRIYGSDVPRNLLALAETDAGLVIEGWVPSVDAVYNTCRVFIAPMRSGAGLKGKVIGALAHGVPCVLSPVAAEGIPLGEGVNACVADTPEEWLSAISRLYQDPQAWADMSRQALVFARKQYGFAKGVAQMQEVLRQAEIFTTTENQTLALR